jgi:ABC-type molybdate transport system substrate-binding protein
MLEPDQWDRVLGNVKGTIVHGTERVSSNRLMDLLGVENDPTRRREVGKRPLPAEVQREVVYAAGVAANSKEPEAAKAFVVYLMSAPAIAVIKAKGMNPS